MKEQLSHALQAAWTAQCSKLKVCLATTLDLLHGLRVHRQWQADRRRSTCAEPKDTSDEIIIGLG